MNGKTNPPIVSASKPQVCLEAKNVNAKKCAQCGNPFLPQRSTGKFCRDSCRVASFTKAIRQDRRISESAQRAAMFLEFDGRTSGQLRDGFGARFRVERQLRRDPIRYDPIPPTLRKDKDIEEAKKNSLDDLKQGDKLPIGAGMSFEDLVKQSERSANAVCAGLPRRRISARARKSTTKFTLAQLREINAE